MCGLIDYLIERIVYMQISKERQVGGSTGWMPTVVIEGRVSRKVGSFALGNGVNSRFLEMYVHDAMYGHAADTVETPSLIATTRGRKLVLPSGTSKTDRSRVASPSALHIESRHA